jgi:hypothetical protein
MDENIIKIFDNLYITSSNVNNDKYKYIININNKNIDNFSKSAIETHNVNIYIEEILLSSSITGIDYNTVNNFILDAVKNGEKVIIYDDSNYIVSFLICSVFMIKKVKIDYFNTILWLKRKLKINSKLYKKLSYQLLLHTC